MERIKPSKKLGQHFLVSRRVARIFSSWVCGYRKVFEIGPGTGFITSDILRSCDEPEIVAGIEIDSRVLENLAALSILDNRFYIVHGDALSPALRLRGFDAGYGSIPYNITGPLLSLLTKWFQKPLLLLIQREVADRLSAKPGSKNYGRLTILVSLVYSVRKLALVPPTAFRPRPRVYSQVVELLPKRSIPPQTIALIEDVTKCFFSQRNKKARKVGIRCLGECVKDIVPGDLRVYELEPDFFLRVIEKCELRPGFHERARI